MALDLTLGRGGLSRLSKTEGFFVSNEMIALGGAVILQVLVWTAHH